MHKIPIAQPTIQNWTKKRETFQSITDPFLIYGDSSKLEENSPNTPVTTTNNEILEENDDVIFIDEITTVQRKVPNDLKITPTTDEKTSEKLQDFSKNVLDKTIEISNSNSDHHINQESSRKRGNVIIDSEMSNSPVKLKNNHKRARITELVQKYRAKYLKDTQHCQQQAQKQNSQEHTLTKQDENDSLKKKTFKSYHCHHCNKSFHERWRLKRHKKSDLHYKKLDEKMNLFTGDNEELTDDGSPNDAEFNANNLHKIQSDKFGDSDESDVDIDPDFENIPYDLEITPKQCNRARNEVTKSVLKITNDEKISKKLDYNEKVYKLIESSNPDHANQEISDDSDDDTYFDSDEIKGHLHNEKDATDDTKNSKRNESNIEDVLKKECLTRQPLIKLKRIGNADGLAQNQMRKEISEKSLKQNQNHDSSAKIEPSDYVFDHERASKVHTKTENTIKNEVSDAESEFKLPIDQNTMLSNLIKTELQTIKDENNGFENGKGSLSGRTSSNEDQGKIQNEELRITVGDIFSKDNLPILTDFQNSPTPDPNTKNVTNDDLSLISGSEDANSISNLDSNNQDHQGTIVINEDDRIINSGDKEVSVTIDEASKYLPLKKNDEDIVELKHIQPTKLKIKVDNGTFKMYTMPNHCETVTLNDVKQFLMKESSFPKKSGNNFEFFVKIIDDGDTTFEKCTLSSAILPNNNGKITLECHTIQ